MAECDRRATCLFFNDRMAEVEGPMDEMPTVASLLKTQYCRGRFETCARYRVAAKLGSTSVPPDLYPQDARRADRIVAGT
jgi:hypothetical protein